MEAVITARRRAGITQKPLDSGKEAKACCVGVLDCKLSGIIELEKRSFIAAILAGVTLFAGMAGIQAQQSYTPGQVFNAGRGQARQAPEATPQPVIVTPQRTPAVQAVRKKQTATTKPAANNRPSAKTVTTRSETEEADTPAKSSESRKVTEKSDPPKEPVPEAEDSTPRVVVPKFTPKPLVLDPDKPVTNAKTGKKMICLTYDDGPDRTYTPRLLEYLKSVGVKATFFMCGNRVKEAPDLLTQMVQEGHELANHTYSHPLLTKLSREKITHELSSTEESIQSASGIKSAVMRPPFGANNATVREICKEMGLRVVIWDIDTEDWRGRSSAQMTNNILKNASDGSIILMHDRQHKGEKDSVMTTTQNVIPVLKKQGYEFVTVTELLAANAALGGQPQRSQVSAQISDADTGVGSLGTTTPVAQPRLIPAQSGPLPGLNN